MIRAILVIVLVMMPYALLRDGSDDAGQVVVLIALFAALFTFVE